MDFVQDILESYLVLYGAHRAGGIFENFCPSTPGDNSPHAYAARQTKVVEKDLFEYPRLGLTRRVYAQWRNPGEIDLQGCSGRTFSKTPHAR